MVEVYIEYCDIQLVNVQDPYQVTSALALIVIFFTDKHITNFFFFTVCKFLQSVWEIVSSTLVGEMKVSLEEILILTVSRKAQKYIKYNIFVFSGITKN